MTEANGNGRLGRMGRCALTYARHGWAVFPQGVDKVPMIRWGELAGPPEHETIARWWRRWPEANIACACGPSGLLVVDADGEAGIAGLEALAAAHGPWPATLCARSGGGGVHLLYRAPSDPVRGGKSGALLRGIDVKAAGGCFTLAPSLHRSGERYVWLEGEQALARAPEWLVARLRELERRRAELPPGAPAPRPRLELHAGGTRYGLAALRGILERLAGASHPGRRDALNVAALLCGHLVAGGELELSRAELELLEVGHEVFAAGPPPEPQEVARTVRDGLADGMRDPRAAPASSARVGGPGLRVNLRTRLETNLRGGVK